MARKHKLTLHFPCYGFDPTRLEEHANAMSRKGWQLEHFGVVTARYRRGAPGEYEYRTQVVRDAGMPKLEYLAELAEMGIEGVGSGSELLLLRKKADGTPFELFSDVDSRIAQQRKARKYMRAGLAMSLFWGSSMAMNLHVLLLDFGIVGHRPNRFPEGVTGGEAAMFVMAAFLLLNCIATAIDCLCGLRHAERNLEQLEAARFIEE